MKTYFKIIIALLFAVIVLFMGYKITSKIKYKNEVTQNIKSIPKFSFKDVEGEVFTNQNLIENTATIFIYFNSECEFCNAEAQMIQEKIVDFHNTQLIFVSFEKPEKIKNFAQAHKLNIYPNVHFLYDEKMNFTKTFDVAGLPTIVIYDKKQKLIEKIKGEIKVAKILNKIN